MPINVTINETIPPISSRWFVSDTKEMIVYLPEGADYAVFFDIFGNITTGYISDDTIETQFSAISTEEVELTLTVKI